MLRLYLNKKTSKTVAGGTKDVEIIVPLKYLSNFWRTLEMSFINYVITHILTWSDKCVLSNDAKATTFERTDTKLYVPVRTLLTQDNAKLLQQLKSGFKKTIHWNKYQSKKAIQVPNPYSYYLIFPSFQGVDRLSVLSFENNTGRTVHIKYYFTTIEIKDYNVMIDEQNFFNKSVKNILRTYDKIWKIETGQGDDYTANCLIDYNYFDKYYKMIAFDLSKQQALDNDPKQYNKLIL